MQYCCCCRCWYCLGIFYLLEVVWTRDSHPSAIIIAFIIHNIIWNNKAILMSAYTAYYHYANMELVLTINENANHVRKIIIYLRLLNIVILCWTMYTTPNTILSPLLMLTFSFVFGSLKVFNHYCNTITKWWMVDIIIERSLFFFSNICQRYRIWSGSVSFVSIRFSSLLFFSVGRTEHDVLLNTF